MVYKILLKENTMDANGNGMNDPLCFRDEHENCECQRKISSTDVASKFNEFIEVYDEFREDNGLSGSVDNVYEALTAMSDKHGRICR